MRSARTQAYQGATAAVHTAAGGAVYVAPDPEPPGARIWFFTRLGGVSDAPYDSLNVSKVVGDEPAAVDENLSVIGEALGRRPSAWVRQVAGDGVARVSGAGFAGEADALVTQERDLCLSVAVADCVPVTLVGQGAVGMVHSGWRGTIAGVSGKAAMRLGPSGIRAYVGPSIRGCCYEVSEELAGRFAREFGDGVVSGRNLSLPDAIRVDLERAGVEVCDLGLCTGCRPDLFYSHRKQGPRT
ncbi:MAG: polyphenol oxidase family protein, partial [Rubrobacter sp.]